MFLKIYYEILGFWINLLQAKISTLIWRHFIFRLPPIAKGKASGQIFIINKFEIKSYIDQLLIIMYIQINMNNRIIIICFMTSFTTTSNCFTFFREIFQKFLSLGIWLETCWQKKMYEGETMAASPSTVIPGLGFVKPVPSSEYSSNIIVKNFPLLGRLHFVKDKNGIMSLAFTFLYWVYGTWCGLWVVLLPHLRDKQTSEPFVGCK